MAATRALAELRLRNRFEDQGSHSDLIEGERAESALSPGLYQAASPFLSQASASPRRPPSGSIAASLQVIHHGRRHDRLQIGLQAEVASLPESVQPLSVSEISAPTFARDSQPPSVVDSSSFLPLWSQQHPATGRGELACRHGVREARGSAAFAPPAGCA